MERTPELAADGLRWLREGGCVDLTAGKPVTLCPSCSWVWLWRRGLVKASVLAVLIPE